MAMVDLLIPEFDEEMAATRRMLERVPDGQASWQPHAKSMTLGRLATHIAEVPGWVTRSLRTDEHDFAPPGGPPFQPRALGSTAEILQLFDQNVAEARRALAAAPDAEFARPWTFKRGGQVIWTRPKHDVFRRMAMSHMVHHRAQLGVYLRLREVAIPGMYGPSADEQPPRR
ncbi:MAG TPA: DinB family protein [Gemmatimonadales bacterium]|nr:DinB family protein [Gemmatimonadales bacterium]